MPKKRLLVFAYSEVGYRCLKLLIDKGEHIVAVFTHADNPNEKIWFHSVAKLAESQTIPVFTPKTLSDPVWLETIKQLQPDLIFSFYYRSLIANDILDTAPLGAYNMHGSLLPKYRGRAPINWAIIHGETETGATLHKMVAKADAGDIIDQESVVIAFEDTAQAVFHKVTEAACVVLNRSLEAIKNQTAIPIKQDLSQGAYFGGRKPADGLIDWHQSAAQIYHLIRAVTQPYPGAFTYYQGRQLTIWWAVPVDVKTATTNNPGEIISTSPLCIQTGQGVLQLLRLQWADELEISADDCHDFAIHDTLSA